MADLFELLGIEAGSGVAPPVVEVRPIPNTLFARLTRDELREKMLSGELTSYHTREFTLDSALADEEWEVEGDNLVAWTDGDISSMSVKLSHIDNDSIKLESFNEPKGHFFKVFITSNAQAGKVLRMYVGGEAAASAASQQVTVSGRRPVNVTPATGTGNIATTTAIGRRFRLDHISIHFSTGTSNSVTISLDANDGVAYDTTIETITTSTTTDVYWEPDTEMIFENGDEIKVAWTNDAAYTYGLRIVAEEI